MRHMRVMRHFGRTAGNICFVVLTRLTKQILKGAFGLFSLMKAHLPHGMMTAGSGDPRRAVEKAKNMRIMRIDEGMVLIGNYLPCIFGGLRRGRETLAEQPKHEAVMRQHEGGPLRPLPSVGALPPNTLRGFRGRERPKLSGGSVCSL
jgi:hypothetical protein